MCFSYRSLFLNKYNYNNNQYYCSLILIPKIQNRASNVFELTIEKLIQTQIALQTIQT